MKSKQGLISKKPLKAKAALKSDKKPLKRGGKGRGPLEKRTQPQLINVADELWSKYIRFRDSELIDDAWIGDCITCIRRLVVYSEGRWVAGAQCGHLIGRGNQQLRFDELNTNLQCAHCNAWLDKDEMISRYRKAVDLKYGEGTYEGLKKFAQENTKNLTKSELLQIITDVKESLEWYEKRAMSQ